MDEEAKTMESARESASGKKKGTKLRPFGRAVRAVVFCVLAGLVFLWANIAFGYDGSVQDYGAMHAYYDREEDSVDVLYIGSSATSRLFAPPYAFEKDGIASYVLGFRAFPSYLYSELIDEACETQHPSVYVVELRPITSEVVASEGDARTTIDSLSLFSTNRLKMIEDALDVMGQNLSEDKFDPEVLDYVLPVVKYHDRIFDGSITSDDLLLNKPYNTMQGFASSVRGLSQARLSDPKYVDEKAKLSAEQKRRLDDVLDRCDELDAPVLFVLSPKLTSKDESMQMNAVAAYVKAKGKTCLNFNTYEMYDELGLDSSTDFYNKSHTNYLGAEKYTAWLSSYLKKNYDLPDRRGDEGYSFWQQGVEDYKDFVKDGIKNVSNDNLADD